METLAYREKSENIRKGAGCSNPSGHLLAAGLSHGSNVEVRAEPVHRSSRGDNPVQMPL